jgi:hypothetical protein
MAEPTGKDKGGAASAGASGTSFAEEGHYEEVAEYRIGEGPPPLGLIVAFALIVIWATVSWIPFFGY